jgi:secreted PhoX family phosphatase
MDRRRFLQCLTAATLPAFAPACGTAPERVGPLRSDPDEILDLPEGFSYRVVSRYGDRMSDGLRVPAAHDGMAAFPGKDGRIILVCNHEIGTGWLARGAFGQQFDRVPEEFQSRLYDAGGGRTPGCGGTTTTVYNPVTRQTEHQFLSLGGTEINCAGGPTPWGSWLSCEECFESPGTTMEAGRWKTRDKRHGYVFEVPASADGLVEPRPLTAMGRFEHEACAVHEATGIVYMTEDKRHSLFYRFIPDEPGTLHAGGRLQALGFVDGNGQQTHNWDQEDIRPHAPQEVCWIDLDDVDGEENNLRIRGAAQGAATFARGEGLCVAGDRFAFTCTIGGPARLGQVFTYAPSPFEGAPGERQQPGRLTLIAESDASSMLRNADNLTMAPWGDLVACEDTSSRCGLLGVRPDGSQYAIADNAYTDSELAGVCFSPDGTVLFVNIQYPGMTLAITGPWDTFL